MTNINILVCGVYDLHHYLIGQGQQGLEITLRHIMQFLEILLKTENDLEPVFNIETKTILNMLDMCWHLNIFGHGS